MKNKKSQLAVVFLSTLIIGACGNGETNSGTASSSESESAVSSEVSQGNQAYQKMYDDALALYEAEKYSEAGGTVGLLLQNNLSEYPDLEAEAKELQEKIQTSHVEVVKEDESYELMEKSEYKDERNSIIISEKFAADTGKDTKEATDEEMKTWLAEEKTVQAESAAPESESVESESESSATESESSAEETVMSPEEEQIHVLNEVIAITGIDPQDNQFFTSKVDDNTYQVEIRHSHEVDGVGISNMVGMYRYDLATEKVQKMDPVTGKYQAVK